jgi:hypothetical protein
LKQYFHIFVQFAFLDAQIAENDFAWPFDILKIRFIDFKKVVFKRPERNILLRLRTSRILDAHDAENEFAWPFDTSKRRYIDFA